jgi:hypothetical protein
MYIYNIFYMHDETGSISYHAQMALFTSINIISKRFCSTLNVQKYISLQPMIFSLVLVTILGDCN